MATEIDAPLSPVRLRHEASQSSMRMLSRMLRIHRYLPDPGLDADWIEDPAQAVENADEGVGFIGIADEVRRRGYSLVKRQG